MHPPESTNYEKFQTRNPIVRRLIDRFYDRVAATIAPLGVASALDAGCGEGETLVRLAGLLPPRVAAVDVSEEAVRFAAQRLPSVDVARHSIENLPFADDSFELVVCLEVLEHLSEPEAALAELARVSAGHLVVSVPHEPWFRVGSLLRGNYMGSLGNHPEHVNHWNARSLRAFLEPHLDVISLDESLPWLIAHCAPRSEARSRPRARLARRRRRRRRGRGGRRPPSEPAGRR